MKTFDKGDLIRCTATFTTSAGVALDPSAVIFETKDPDGNVTTLIYGEDDEVVKLSTGVYYVDVDADQAGQWWCRFYSTGTGQAAEEEKFIVNSSEF